MLCTRIHCTGLPVQSRLLISLYYIILRFYTSTEVLLQEVKSALMANLCLSTSAVASDCRLFGRLIPAQIF